MNSFRKDIGMKTLIMVADSKPNWGSCVSIRENLLASYSLLEKTSIDIHPMMTKGRGEALVQARDIFNSKPDRIVFIDHQPHPLFLLEQLAKVYSQVEQKHRPEIIFHVYGDYIYDASSWISSEKFLMLFIVKFICASEAQMHLVQKSINQKNVCVTSPFPVDEVMFSYDQQKRTAAREKLGLDENERVFLYTGRLSRQKSIIELIKIFSSFLQKLDTSATLLLAGSFDDLGVPYLNFFDGPNRYFVEVLKAYNSFPESSKNKIRFLGQFDSEDLSSIYNAADIFISLSVHNDEDFGMAPAEAGMSGLPLILTDWGGYKSFKFSLLDCCDFVPVNIRQNGFLVNNDRTQGLIGKWINAVHSDEKRESISESFRKKFSIKAVARSLELINQTRSDPFQGFKTDFKKEVMNSVRSSRPLFANNILVYNEYYRKLYASYF